MPQQDNDTTTNDMRNEQQTASSQEKVEAQAASIRPDASQTEEQGGTQSDAPAGEMSFWDHLEVLRWMLIRILVVWGVVLLAGFGFIPWLFDHVIMAPSRSDFFLYRLFQRFSEASSFMPGQLIEPFHVTIINIRLASQFFLHMELAFWLSLLVTFPYIVFEVWRFVCPALYQNERRGVRFTFILGTVLFFVGCFVGYAIVFPLTLRFLYTYQLSATISNQLSLDSYMSNFLMLTFMMGIIFELPLVSMLLGRLGILHRSFFHRYRRHAIVVLLTVSAFITPSADPFTLMAVFLPIYVLWELSAFLIKESPTPSDGEEGKPAPEA